MIGSTKLLTLSKIHPFGILRERVEEIVDAAGSFL